MSLPHPPDGILRIPRGSKSSIRYHFIFDCKHQFNSESDDMQLVDSISREIRLETERFESAANFFELRKSDKKKTMEEECNEIDEVRFRANYLKEVIPTPRAQLNLLNVLKKRRELFSILRKNAKELEDIGLDSESLISHFRNSRILPENPTEYADSLNEEPSKISRMYKLLYPQKWADWDARQQRQKETSEEMRSNTEDAEKDIRDQDEDDSGARPQKYPPYYTEGDFTHSIGTSEFSSFGYQVIPDHDLVRSIQKKNTRNYDEGEKHLSYWQLKQSSWINSIKIAHNFLDLRLDCSTINCKGEAKEGCHVTFIPKINYLYEEDEIDGEMYEVEISSPDPIYLIIPICKKCHRTGRTSNSPLSISIKAKTRCIIDTRKKKDIIIDDDYKRCKTCNKWWLHNDEKRCYYCDKFRY